MRRWPLLAVLLGCTPGVPGGAAPAAGLVRVAQDTVYADVDSSEVSLTIRATLVNRTRDTLWVHPCLQMEPYPPVARLERAEGAGWSLAAPYVCTQALMLDPPRLAPGESRTDTIWIWAPRSGLLQFAPGPVEGEYRLVYDDVFRRWYGMDAPQGAADGLGERLPTELLTSNPFRVAVRGRRAEK
jgi:hypothetical protein